MTSTKKRLKYNQPEFLLGNRAVIISVKKIFRGFTVKVL